MFLLLPLIIFIIYFKSIFSLKIEYISNCNYNLEKFQNYTLRTLYESNETNCDCLSSSLTNITNSTYAKIIICTLKCWKNNPTKFNNFVENVKAIIPILDKLNLTKMGKIIVNITKKIVNNEDTIHKMTDLLNKTNFTDIMIEIIEILIMPESEDKLNKTIAYDLLYRLVNIEQFWELFKTLYYESRTDILDLVEEFFTNYDSTLADVFKFLRKKLGNILDEVFSFIFNMIKIYKNKDEMFDTITEFLIKNHDNYDKIKEVMKDGKIKALYNILIDISDPILNHTKNIILGNDEFLEMFLNIIEDTDSLILGTEILKKINDFNFIKEKMVGFLSRIVNANSSMVEPLTYFFFELIFNVTNNNDELSVMAFSALQMFLKNIFEGLNYTQNIEGDCRALFEYTYFDDSKSDKSLFFLYLQKYLFDSSRNKGNFLPFDNCMDDNVNISTRLEYNISPAYIIGILNEYQQKDSNQNSSFYFKYNYLKGYCFPFAYKNETQKKKKIPMCSDEEYKAIFLALFHFYSNISDINITAFSINKSNIYPSPLEDFFGVLGILILAFPILIYIFLLISGNIIANKQKKINKIDKTNKNLKTKKNRLIEVNNERKKKKIIYPRWYQYLNEFFNIKKNGNELFNFSLNTNYNNFKGMTYIKGMIGIFSILTIFGQTFIALFNLPTKSYGIWDYYLTMSSFFYFFLYIAYRYSPRILFSCSGYTLIYKYLCYIEQDQRLYFLKFVFLQSYKYILLIFIIIIIRFPLYYIVFLIRQSKRPTWEIFKYFIDNDKKFFMRFFTFLIYLDDKDSSIKQNLIFYFHIPINEILFFIFGTGLISLGYKFKLRIDIIIFALILLIYIIKIILFLKNHIPDEKIYTTIDYYLFKCGLNLIHPIFNLNYFLIGMFFGLINYSIQKGITDLEKKNYQNVFLLLDSKNINNDDDKEDEEKEKEAQTIKKQRTFSFVEMNTDMSGLNINRVSKTGEPLLKTSNNNNKLYRDFINQGKTNQNRNTNDINNINTNTNENLEQFIIEENGKGTKKIEYSERIKQMPFLIWPIKFSNIHKEYKNKLFLTLIIILAILLVIFFIFAQVLFIVTNIETDLDGKQLVEELSFRKIITTPALNVIFLLDMEIAIFIIHWVNFVFDFKEFGIIKNFLNHAYWAFFAKSYFSFNLISVTVILFLFYITETSIKFNFSNIILYSFIDLILILLFTIVIYSCFELPLKKVFKFFLKGKEALNNEEDDQYDEDEENNENEEGKYLKGSGGKKK